MGVRYAFLDFPLQIDTHLQVPTRVVVGSATLLHALWRGEGPYFFEFEVVREGPMLGSFLSKRMRTLRVDRCEEATQALFLFTAWCLNQFGEHQFRATTPIDRAKEVYYFSLGRLDQREVEKNLKECLEWPMFS